MSKKKTIDFKFRKHDNIGAADADDDNFLEDCFVDTGDIDILSDCSNSQSIIVGRTGAGKTALVKMLAKKCQRAINIPPESLALSYISNSTILRYVEDLGVNLDIFYKLLWRHVFTVELLKKHFQIYSEEDKRNFWQKIWLKFSDQKNRKALEYLERWGKSFWEETEYRIQEVARTLEKNIQGEVGSMLPNGVVSGNIGGSYKITDEQRGDIVERAQKVVNEVQIRQLSDIINLLDEILDDEQKQYYILIDRLDEGWIEDRLRYRLIRALIETVKDFRKIRHAKIIVAIRQDLMDRIFRLIRGAGFQEEKYESMYLRIYWTNDQLQEILTKRINHLIKSRYTKQKVDIEDLFPRSIDKKKPADYIIERTLSQPRDIIHFINKSIEQVLNKKNITAEALKSSESEYSRDRLRYLADEWHSDYPNLIEFSKILRKKNSRLPIVSLNRDCEELCLEYACVNIGSSRPECSSYLAQLAFQVAHAVEPVEVFRNALVRALYIVGMVGVKFDSYEKHIWSLGHRSSFSLSEFNDRARLEIHRAFWSVFGIIENKG